MTFIKHDSEKPKWGLLGPLRIPLEYVAKVTEYGANKYSRDNWKHCEDTERYYDAAQRHLWAYQEGEYLDKDSGLPHLAHAAWNCLVLIWFKENRK